MYYYQNLPLYLKLVQLLKQLYIIRHNLPKEYKFTLGEDITKLNWQLIDLFVKAQSTEGGGAKKEIIIKLNSKYDSFKIRVRFLSELRLISVKQTAHLNEQIVEIGKMIGSWLKKV